MLWTAFEIALNLIQSLMFLFFIKSRLHITKPHRIADIACSLAIAFFYTLYTLIDISFPDTFVVFIPFLYALAVADDKWYVSAFWTLVLAILFLTTVDLCIHIFETLPGLSYEAIMSRTGGRVLFVLLTNLTLFLILYAVSRLKREYTSLTWPVFVLFLLTIFTLFVVEEAVYSLQMKQTSLDARPFFVAYIGIFLCTILMILLFHIMSLTTTRESQYKAEVQAMSLSQRHLKELARLYQEISGMQHDFKQHYQVLEEMVKSGDSQEAQSYLDAYRAELPGRELFLTGRSAVDALLTAKRLTMKKLGVCFKFTAYPLNRLPIAEPDFCSIVGNLLDNAIEGVQRISEPGPQPVIHLTFACTWNVFYIFCTNPCDPRTIQKQKDGWRSSKLLEGLPGRHAIGIRSIEKLAAQAEGRCSFAVEGSVFRVQVVLPYPFDVEETQS